MDNSELLRQRIQQLETELTEVRQKYRDGLNDLSKILRPTKGFMGTLIDGVDGEWYTKADLHEF